MRNFKTAIILYKLCYINNGSVYNFLCCRLVEINLFLIGLIAKINKYGITQSITGTIAQIFRHKNTT
jgi:hypothetical protein